jgi:uncharacterized protein (DUF1501 family)
MNRRKFLGNTALFTVPLMLQGVPVFAGDGALSPFLQSLTDVASNCGKILVIIQMNGGNDGLNMVIPLDKYTQLASARPNVLIPAAQTLPLTGTTTTALNPGMGALKNMYDNGKVCIVQGVSYPNPNFSHFQAQDIWFTGSNTLPTPSTGWLGRQLDFANPGFPTGYPNAANPDPIAIQIGGILPLLLQGANINMAYNAPDPNSLIQVATATASTAPANEYGQELTFLRLMKDQSNAYTTRISAAYNGQATLSTMYTTDPFPDNDLSTQLKVVARLIGGGLQTSVYVVNHPLSFDTHIDQVVAGAPNTGFHVRALKILSEAIAAFQNDITLMGKADKVTGMTFSEFGRRVINNTSQGTDHGSGAPVIFFGAKVNGGIIGDSPIIPAVSNANTQVPMQYDYRQLYASVMQQWFCMTAPQSQTVLNAPFSTLPIFFLGTTPVSGIELTAVWQGDSAKISFKAHENEQFEKFEIERSTNATTFDDRKILNATNGTDTQDYYFAEDRMRASNVFYRVAGTTKTGLTVYSNIVKLTNGAEQAISVFPNPVTNHTINIEFLKTVNENVSITIFGAKGEKLYHNQLNPAGRKTITFKVPDYFDVHTLYILNVVYGSTVVNEKIVFE